MKYLVILFEIARPYIKKVFGRTRHICPQYSTKIPEGLDPSLAEGYTKYSCSYCKYSSFYKGNVQRHMRKHTGERPFSCSYCQKKFTQKENMLIHENLHAQSRLLMCHICKECFRSASSLGIHMLDHNL
nr:zinc finger and BTB domain-containing protein 46 [Parasteatoda tepidariorum]